jgi:hypothetical protein
MTAQTCECLFCQSPAIARFTVPHHKPRFLICETHLSDMLDWAARYRDIPGAVCVEQVGAPNATQRRGTEP